MTQRHHTDCVLAGLATLSDKLAALSGGKLITGGTQDSVQPAGPGPRGQPGGPDLQVVTLYRPDTVILAVSGDLDVASAPVLRAHIGFALGRQPPPRPRSGRAEIL